MHILTKMTAMIAALAVAVEIGGVSSQLLPATAYSDDSLNMDEMRGDVDGNGSIDAGDAAYVLLECCYIGTGKESLLLENFSEKSLTNADVDKDGAITAEDAMFILKYAAYIGAGGIVTMEEIVSDIFQSDDSYTISADTVEHVSADKAGQFVPIYIRTDANELSNALEFGIEVDSRCNYEIIKESNKSNELGGEYLDVNMTYEISDQQPGFLWLSSASTNSRFYDDPAGNLVLVMLEIPQDAQPGERYTVSIISDNAYRTVDDVRYGIEGVDGGIVIEGETATEPTTPPEETEPTTPPSSNTSTLQWSNGALKNSEGLGFDDVTITMSELAARNYQVPVYLRTAEPLLSIFGFGVEIDKRCTVDFILDPDAALLAGGEKVGDGFSYPGIEENVFWINGGYHINSWNLMLLMVTLPESAQVGDEFRLDPVSTVVVDAEGEYREMNQGFVIASMEYHSWPTYSGRIRIVEESEKPTEDTAAAYGDINGDGEIDLVDVIKLNKHLMIGAELSPDALANADVDNNGVVDEIDSLNILKSIINLVTLPIK